jgi:alpha-L-fucosidase
VLKWPGKRPAEMTFLAPGNQRIGKIQGVELLGHDGPVKWEHHPDGLRVWFPAKKPCEFAYCLKIHLPQK